MPPTTYDEVEKLYKGIFLSITKNMMRETLKW